MNKTQIQKINDIIFQKELELFKLKLNARNIYREVFLSVIYGSHWWHTYNDLRLYFNYEENTDEKFDDILEAPLGNDSEDNSLWLEKYNAAIFHENFPVLTFKSPADTAKFIQEFNLIVRKI
jgi:hypothetical protein